MISIDGLRPEFYLSDQWQAPTLRRLCREGAWARRMIPVFPSITYANHTSLITGVRPYEHGIENNITFDWSKGPLPDWNWDSRLIRVPALWDRARAKKLPMAAFSWPVSLGAPVDWLIPEYFHVPGANEGTTESLLRKTSTPGLLQSRPGPFPTTFEEWDRWMPETFRSVWQRPNGPRLALVHMLNMDLAQHRFGPEAPETYAALPEMDRCIARLVEAVDPRDTTVLIVGDHGFQHCPQWVSPNRLFVERGWIELDAKNQIRSWRVLARANGGSAAVYCKDPKLLEEVRALLERHRGPYEIVSSDAFRGASFALAAARGYAVRGSVDKPFVEPNTESPGQHGHRPEWVPTGFIAWGYGIEPRALGEIQLLQVAPTICKWLSLPSGGMRHKPLPI